MKTIGDTIIEDALPLNIKIVLDKSPHSQMKGSITKSDVKNNILSKLYSINKKDGGQTDVSVKNNSSRNKNAAVT